MFTGSNYSWNISEAQKTRYVQGFRSLGPQGSKITGQASREYFMRSGLPTSVLGNIWELSDIDRDGSLTIFEFFYACMLIEARLKGVAVPTNLPRELIQSVEACVASLNASSNVVLPTAPSTQMASNAQNDLYNNLSSVFDNQVSTTQKPPDPRLDYYILCYNVLKPHGEDGITGKIAREFFPQSGLSLQILADVWKKSDQDGDGVLNQQEFISAMRLIDQNLYPNEFKAISITKPNSMDLFELKSDNVTHKLETSMKITQTTSTPKNESKDPNLTLQLENALVGLRRENTNKHELLNILKSSELEIRKSTASTREDFSKLESLHRQSFDNIDKKVKIIMDAKQSRIDTASNNVNEVKSVQQQMVPSKPIIDDLINLDFQTVPTMPFVQNVPKIAPLQQPSQQSTFIEPDVFRNQAYPMPVRIPRSTSVHFSTGSIPNASDTISNNNQNQNFQSNPSIHQNYDYQPPQSGIPLNHTFYKPQTANFPQPSNKPDTSSNNSQNQFKTQSFQAPPRIPSRESFAAQHSRQGYFPQQQTQQPRGNLQPCPADEGPPTTAQKALYSSPYLTSHQPNRPPLDLPPKPSLPFKPHEYSEKPKKYKSKNPFKKLFGIKSKPRQKGGYVTTDRVQFYPEKSSEARTRYPPPRPYANQPIMQQGYSSQDHPSPNMPHNARQYNENPARPYMYSESSRIPTQSQNSMAAYQSQEPPQQQSHQYGYEDRQTVSVEESVERRKYSISSRKSETSDVDQSNKFDTFNRYDFKYSSVLQGGPPSPEQTSTVRSPTTTASIDNMETFAPPLTKVAVKNFVSSETPAFQFSVGDHLSIMFKHDNFYYAEINEIGDWFPFDLVKDVSEGSGVTGFENSYTLSGFRVALYDNEAEETDEIPFAAGDVLIELEVLDEWIRGYGNGISGIYPAEYTKAISHLEKIGVFTAVQNHDSTNQCEISIAIGDIIALLHNNSTGWSVGVKENSDDIGFFPTACIQS